MEFNGFLDIITLKLEPIITPEEIRNKLSILLIKNYESKMRNN